MQIKDILALTDHTCLKIDATWEDIKRTVDEGIEFNTASVCIPLQFVKRAVEYADGRIKICTVIGFPHGNTGIASKTFEAHLAHSDGAAEVDMVINIGALKEGDKYTVRKEIREVRAVCHDIVLKVIVESGMLNHGQLGWACRIAAQAGADFVKTSTGFNGTGATTDAVKIMKRNITGDMQVKASGGIRSFEDAEIMIDAGATRIGSSSLVKIAKEMNLAVGDNG